MKILLLNPILYTADKNIIPKVSSIKDCMIYNMGMGFKNLGHEVTLIAAEDYKPTENETYDFEILFLPSKYKKVLLPSVLPYLPELRKYLKKSHQHYDLVISSETFSFNSLFASIICPEKTLIWHELALHNRKFRYIPSKIWYQIVVPLVFKNIVTTPRSLSALNFIRKYKPKYVTLPVEHGVNIDRFSYQSKKKKQFIIVSQLIARKNIESILMNFFNFLQKYQLFEFKLLIVGRGPLQKDLENKMKDLDLETQVELLGFKCHEELKYLVAESMALLINTKQDNNMVSIPEAIVSGTPLLMNSVPTNAYIVKENNLGIVKDGWDESDMKTIVENNTKFIQNCIAYRQKLSAEACAQNLINAFVNENPSRQ